jgi:hypothetical protein
MRTAVLASLLFALLSVARHARCEDEYRTALLAAMVAKEKAADSHLQEDWQEALRRIRHAEDFRVTVESKYELAYIEAELGMKDLALGTYELALELGLSGLAADKAKKFIEEQAPMMSRVDVRGPAGSRLRVRGIDRGQLPLEKPVYVLPGASEIELVTPANELIQRQPTLVAGQVEIVSLEKDETRGGNMTPTLRDSPKSEGHHTSESPRTQTPQTAKPKIHLEDRSDVIATRRRTGWLLLGTGTAVGALSGIFIPTSASKIRTGRQALMDACDVQVDGPDSCANAKPGLQAEGQVASDSIAKWKAVRTSAWIGLATGILAAGTGATLLVTSPSANDKLIGAPKISFGRQSLVISLDGRF